jgi:hypothetical protein
MLDQHRRRRHFALKAIIVDAPDAITRNRNFSPVALDLLRLLRFASPADDNVSRRLGANSNVIGPCCFLPSTSEAGAACEPLSMRLIFKLRHCR